MLESRETKDPGFFADLKAAVSTWRVAPMLPVLAILLELPLALQAEPDDPLLAITLLWVIVQPGWQGAQRVWYARLFRGEELTARQLPRLWRGFFWRFARLGVLWSLPVWILLGAAAISKGRAGWFVATFTATYFVVGLLLTFVTPALTFTTDKVRAATSLGVGMIRETWPACLPYVLVPPLATVAIARGLSLVLDTVAVLIVSVVVASLARGATARFYLRRHNTGPFGYLGAASAVPARPDV